MALTPTIIEKQSRVATQVCGYTEAMSAQVLVPNVVQKCPAKETKNTEMSTYSNNQF